MHLSVLAEILDRIRYMGMLQELSPLKREEIVIFICEQYEDYVESDAENAAEECRNEAEGYRRSLSKIAREIEQAGF